MKNTMILVQTLYVEVDHKLCLHFDIPFKLKFDRHNYSLIKRAEIKVLGQLESGIKLTKLIPSIK
jgi:hypothetical protein